MRLSATAWSRNTGYVHKLKDAAIGENSMSGTADGGVVVQTKISSDGLTGDFRLTMTLSADEVMALAKVAATGALHDRVAKLEKKLAALA